MHGEGLRLIYSFAMLCFFFGGGGRRGVVISNALCYNCLLLPACIVVLDLQRLLGTQSTEETKKKRKFKKGKRHRKIIAVSTLFIRGSLPVGVI